MEENGRGKRDRAEIPFSVPTFGKGERKGKGKREGNKIPLSPLLLGRERKERMD